jgi:hypothetical protein
MMKATFRSETSKPDFTSPYSQLQTLHWSDDVAAVQLKMEFLLTADEVAVDLKIV